MRKVIYILLFSLLACSVSAQRITLSGGKPILTGGKILRIFTPNELGTQFSWTGTKSGSDLVGLDGTVIPYVSGSGLDAIYDFSVLSDNFWNKNSYLGNSYGLPEYWDFPWNDSIYYDSGNPYRWKLKDFHYRYISDQYYSTEDKAFAKLNYTGEVLQSVSELYLYTTAINDADSIKATSYIGIRDVYYTPNLIINPNFNGNSVANWVKYDAGVSFQAINNQAVLEFGTSTFAICGGMLTDTLEIGDVILVEFELIENTVSSTLSYGSVKVPTWTGNFVTVASAPETTYSAEITTTIADQNSFFVRINEPKSTNQKFIFDDCSLKIKYQNYYKNEKNL